LQFSEYGFCWKKQESWFDFFFQEELNKSLKKYIRVIHKDTRQQLVFLRPQVTSLQQTTVVDYTHTIFIKWPPGPLEDNSFKELFYNLAHMKCYNLLKKWQNLKNVNGTVHLKNVSNCLSTNINSYLETSGGQISILYLNVVQFFNTSVN